jgi:hypothetical protein
MSTETRDSRPGYLRESIATVLESSGNSDKTVMVYESNEIKILE